MSKELIIRKYNNDDCETVSRLFYDTVHSVNAKDYACEQLFAWARSPEQLQYKRDVLLKQNTIVAQIEKIIVGFASIDNGYLDLLYVHKDYQRKGIATALCNELEQGLAVIKTHASITALPFFEKRGYAVVKEQTVERFGVKLKNYEMQKYALRPDFCK